MALLPIVMAGNQAGEHSGIRRIAIRTDDGQPVTKIGPGTESAQNLDVGMSPAGQHQVLHGVPRADDRCTPSRTLPYQAASALAGTPSRNRSGNRLTSSM